MTAFIDVGSVLRGTVCDLYSNLVTRPTGAAVRTAIERQVSELGPPVVTTIDFSQVNLLDFSCADEIVAKLLLRYTSDDGPAGYLTFRGLHDGHLDPIETVLQRHGLALVSWYDGEAELFGEVCDDERRHWDVVRLHGPVAAPDVAARLDSDAGRAAHWLEQLARRRLLMRRGETYAVPGTVTAPTRERT
ncbi:MAG: hypothetical protein LCH84_17805 [Gemmatimonadetes bacterium]|nr:hypothetical protein [Gemmatimonadota bacterium]